MIHILAIILIIAFSLSHAYFIYALIKAFKEGAVSWIAVALVSLLGALFIIYLSYSINEIRPSEWAQILLLLGLVGVTGFYALSATRQANASKEMAEEMKDARYDALRPIIDIVEQTVEPREMATRAYNAKEGIFPKKLSCQLRNIGVGPAVEVYSFIEDARGETCRWDFGAIPVAIGEEEMGYTCEMPLSLQQRGEHKALVAYYKDVYDNPFESSREVCLDREKSALKIGPLKIRPLPKEENIND